MQISSLAPVSDFKAAEMESVTLTAADALGLHFVSSKPGINRVEHLIVNQNAQFIKIVV